MPDNGRPSVHGGGVAGGARECAGANLGPLFVCGYLGIGRHPEQTSAIVDGARHHLGSLLLKSLVSLLEKLLTLSKLALKRQIVNFHRFPPWLRGTMT